MSVSHDHPTDEEKIRILSRGLKAALRWPYDTSMLKHIADPSTAINQNFDDRYLDDVQEVRSALRIAKAVTND
jgi:hypothetical protein